MDTEFIEVVDPATGKKHKYPTAKVRVITEEEALASSRETSFNPSYKKKRWGRK